MTAPRRDSWTLYCDGGSRGNPGPAASAYVLTGPDGHEVEARGEALGSTTNNVAEYRALLSGLEAAARHGASPLSVHMDSELVIRQMTGEYRVKNEGLKPLHQRARQAAARIAEVHFVAVRREKNARANRLVNDTLDGLTSSESPR